MTVEHTLGPPGGARGIKQTSAGIFVEARPRIFAVAATHLSDKNRHTLDTLVGYSYEQGMLKRRWPLDASLIIHRYGRLEPGANIVLCITASAHRQAAFEANEFLVDWLKTKAPFWKLESGPKGESWVAAKSSDDKAADRWNVAPAAAKRRA